MVAGLALALFSYYGPMVRSARETALKVGLVNIRTAIQIYRIHQGAIPADLKELLKTHYIKPHHEGSIFVGAYLLGQAVDRDGYPVDPFGHTYSYDATKGTVRSQTTRYQGW